MMGQSKEKLSRVLAMSHKCIFCGGKSPAATIDHQPARSLFDKREWPEGYEFPACEPCNQFSKDAEHKLAILVRIDSEREDDPVRRAEFKKLLVAMRNNFPGLLSPLSANAKRRLLRTQGHERPPGMALADIHAAGIEAEAADQLFDITMIKLLKALHWKHTGCIVRFEEGIKVIWYTNAYFGLFQNSEEARFYMALPAIPPILRNRKNLADQFSYRYGRDDLGELSAFLISFRNSLIVTGIVAQSDEMLTEIRAQDSAA